MVRHSPRALLLGIAASASALAASAPRVVQAQTNSVPREEVVAWLRHQEQLVRSMECEIECRMEPTSPQTDEQIRTLLREWKQEERHKGLFVSKEDADRHSYLRRFWRKGQGFQGVPKCNSDKGLRPHKQWTKGVCCFVHYEKVGRFLEKLGLFWRQPLS